MRFQRLAIATAIAASAVFAGCTTTTTTPKADSNQSTATEKRASVNSAADATLARLYQQSPDSRALVQRARAVLIFPEVLSGAFVVGLEHGTGVLRVAGRNEGYYTTTGGSIGFQAGAQSKAMVIAFATDAAYQKFINSKGWTVGADANVAVASIGANGNIDSNTARQPVVAFVMNNGGLMAGLSIDGTKISPANF